MYIFLQNLYIGLKAFPVESSWAAACIVCNKTRADGPTAASASGSSNPTDGMFSMALDGTD